MLCCLVEGWWKETRLLHHGGAFSTHLSGVAVSCILTTVDPWQGCANLLVRTPALQPLGHPSWFLLMRSGSIPNQLLVEETWWGSSEILQIAAGRENLPASRLWFDTLNLHGVPVAW